VSLGGETGDEVAAKKQKETVQALDTEELPEIHTRSALASLTLTLTLSPLPLPATFTLLHRSLPALKLVLPRPAVRMPSPFSLSMGSRLRLSLFIW
jgi:hypothetical protein